MHITGIYNYPSQKIGQRQVSPIKRLFKTFKMVYQDHSKPIMSHCE